MIDRFEWLGEDAFVASRRNARSVALVCSVRSIGEHIETVRTWASDSITSGLFETTRRRMEEYGNHALLGSALRVVIDWISASWLYRWLTAEPDPDVIVIDLRETVTVGPILAVLERAIALLARGRGSSRSYSVGTAIVDGVATSSIWESRTVQLAVALLEPPAPPEDRQDRPRDCEP
ncbi:MAG: hypothetical protein ACOCQY_04440 [Halorhabdus sp.]